MVEASEKISHDAGPVFLVNRLREEQPELVPLQNGTSWYDAYLNYIKKVPGWTSHRKVAEKMKESSHGNVSYYFEKITHAISELKETAPPVGEEKPALTFDRVNEILEKGKKVKQDPYALIPEASDPKYKYLLDLQNRRGPRKHAIASMVDDVIQHGIVDMPVIQDRQPNRFIDGEKRLRAWINANEKLGGDRKIVKLEFPVCLLLDVDDAEAKLIALFLNQGRDDWDTGDRDYALVRMHEEHPEVYTVTRLAEIYDLDKSTVSKIISGWQDNYPKDELKNPIRELLKQRAITTFHGRQLARLKKWPKEQRRIAKWLIQEVEDHRRTDGYYRGWDGSFDESGVSSGTLQMMVNSAKEKMENASVTAEIAKQLKKEGLIKDEISEKEYRTVRKKAAEKAGIEYIDSMTKTAVNLGLKEAGIKVKSTQSENDTKKPKSPARAHEDREQEEVPPCMTCVLYYAHGEICPIGLTPDEENNCVAQIPGRPAYHEMRCVYCGGVTIPKFAEVIDIPVYINASSRSINHALCESEVKFDDVTAEVHGKCDQCMNYECPLFDVDHNEFPEGMKIHIEECPETEGTSKWNNWFIPKPHTTPKAINQQMEILVKNFKEMAQKKGAKSALQWVLKLKEEK